MGALKGLYKSDMKLRGSDLMILLTACYLSKDGETFEWRPSIMAKWTGYSIPEIQKARKRLEIKSEYDSQGNLLSKEGFFEFIPKETMKERQKYLIRLPISWTIHISYKRQDSRVDEISNVSNTRHISNNKQTKQISNKEINKEKDLKEIARSKFTE